MENIRYYYFIDLARTLNFTETAEHFYTTQSNISKQIKALEASLQVNLFDRTHRQIVLSSAGEILLPYAKNLVSMERKAIEHLNPLIQNDTNIIHISAIPIMTSYQIPQIFASFQKKFFPLSIRVKEVESVFIADDLNKNRCDIAFCRIFDSFDCTVLSLEKIVLRQDYFIVVLPCNHPLAKKDMISFSDIKDENYYQLNQNTQLMQELQILCQTANFSPHIVYEGTRIDNILSFIRNQLGISILMRYSLPDFKDTDICIRPLEFTRNSELVFLRRNDIRSKKATQTFWNYAKTLYSSKKV